MTDEPADTFGVGVHATETELEFVVHVPSSLDANWSDPETFQSLVADVVWDRLDREPTLRAVPETADVGETVGLGTVRLRADGTVVDADLSAPTDG